MPAIMETNTPREASGQMFQQRTKTQSFPKARTSAARPLSEATEFLDTDFEDDSSEFEEYSPKGSFETVGWQRYSGTRTRDTNNYTGRQKTKSNNNLVVR